MSSNFSEILESRKNMIAGLPRLSGDPVEEGGCGVVGFAASIPVRGKHIFEPSVQMHNRGNGKGGGIAAAGLVPEQLGVDAASLRDDYILQIALLNPEVEEIIEEEFITPRMQVKHKQRIKPQLDYRTIGLEVKPPDVVRYFIRVKEHVLKEFAQDQHLENLSPRLLEDEYIYQNSFNLNQKYYASLGEKQAFVLSHARNLVIFKIVGYAEQVVQYYGLEDFKASVWIAHQRYPTKGRVWHPAGAHPFIGMNEALVHNGDFANYYSISQYLHQHNIRPQFLTDTEVSVLLFDLLHRVYGYPTEYVIEALAPTTELDFMQLPAEKQKIYRAIQSVHMHGSPDGPWFFIIARSNPDKDEYQLLGITDTAMLRPQVFALQEGDVSIGLIGSEKQAIDATLQSLAAEDPRFRPIADRYWNARGGSHTDGGSFAFTVQGQPGHTTLSCTDKFGKPIEGAPGEWPKDRNITAQEPDGAAEISRLLDTAAAAGDSRTLFPTLSSRIATWNFPQVQWLLQQMVRRGNKNGPAFTWALELLALLNNRRYNCGRMKRSVVLQLIREAITALLDGVPWIDAGKGGLGQRIDWARREHIRAPEKDEAVLVIQAHDFPMEGDDCDARLLVKAYTLGWKRFIVYGLKGQRFTGCGLGAGTAGVHIDVFGSSGDYLASGIDGMEITVHDNAQDQLGQIMKSGKLVVHGDVGQTFMYGAKGGEVYIMGNAAGRPLINAVGKPRVVINGTCLDFLAESFMAGDPLNGGGFVILNGVTFNEKDGTLKELETPYPGSNLFSLASGGAMYVRDPQKKLVADQLNGGGYYKMTPADWALIHPYLQENEKHFGITVAQLLTVNGAPADPLKVFRKIAPKKHTSMEEEDDGL